MFLFAAMFLCSYTLGYWVACRTHEYRDYHRALQRNRADLRKSLVNRGGK